MITQIARSIQGSSFERELASLYIACFAEPPWNEVFSEVEVVEWFREMLGNPLSLGLVFWQNREVGGALFAIPVSEKPDVVELLGGRCAPEECLYIAEVFVAKRFRRHGIGTALQAAALESARERSFRFVSERTNFNSKMCSLIQRAGFETVATQRVASRKFIRGRKVMRSDERGIFLLKL